MSRHFAAISAMHLIRLVTGPAIVFLQEYCHEDYELGLRKHERQIMNHRIPVGLMHVANLAVAVDMR